MATKILAALNGAVVAALLTVDTTVTPGIAGKDVPSIFTDDVSAYAGVATGWVKNADGTFSAPPGPSLAAAQTAQNAMLNAACAVAITGNFSSSALGAAHVYGSKQTDQDNLDADMMAAMSQTGTGTGANAVASVNCSADGGTTWAVQSHNQSQIIQLWSDFRTWRIACQTKNRTFQAQVAAATTVAAVQAVIWA